MRTRLRRWILEPLVRGLTGLPLAVAAIPTGPAGRAGAAARLVARFPVTGAPAGDRRPGAARLLGYGLLAVPAFGLAAMQLFLAYSGYLYPLRPDTIAALGHPFTADRQVLPEAWGGPTLVGAWAVHSVVALGMQVLCGVLLVGSCAAQNRLMAAGVSWGGERS